MKNRKSTVIQLSTYIFLFLLSLFVVYSCTVYLIVHSSAKSCYGNTNQELLRIKIYGSSTTEEGDTVSGTFSIVDSNGNEIAVIERSWSGPYLSVEFSQCKLNNQYYIFPTRIFGRNRIFDVRNYNRRGTDLSRYYNENGQCMLLGYGSTLKQRKALFKIACYTLKKYMVFDFFNKRSTLSVDLSGCRTGYYYSIGTTDNGDLTIQQL